ncbi:MAG: gamma-glutamylcyclotransferase family protein [Pseudomonadales bacterium]
MSVDFSAVSYYFAYGSNMNPARVRARKMEFEECHAGKLRDFRLTFNKRSVKYPGAAAANVMPHKGAATEGVLYKLQDPGQISMMDPYEGYPVRYDRQALSVVYEGQGIQAWVYIANDRFVAEGLKPARWYLGHLLAGEEYLSSPYFKELEAVACLPDSSVEPLPTGKN